MFQTAWCSYWTAATGSAVAVETGMAAVHLAPRPHQVAAVVAPGWWVALVAMRCRAGAVAVVAAVADLLASAAVVA